MCSEICPFNLVWYFSELFRWTENLKCIIIQMDNFFWQCSNTSFWFPERSWPENMILSLNSSVFDPLTWGQIIIWHYFLSMFYITLLHLHWLVLYWQQKGTVKIPKVKVMKLFISHQNLNMNYCSSTAKTCNSCSIRIFTYLQQQIPRQSP